MSGKQEAANVPEGARSGKQEAANVSEGAEVFIDFLNDNSENNHLTALMDKVYQEHYFENDIPGMVYQKWALLVLFFYNELCGSVLNLPDPDRKSGGQRNRVATSSVQIRRFLMSCLSSAPFSSNSDDPISGNVVDTLVRIFYRDSTSMLVNKMFHRFELLKQG